MSVIDEIKELQDKIVKLETSANDLEQQAEAAREKAKELRGKVELALKCIEEVDADRRAARNEMEEALNSIYLDVLTNPDPSGFRLHIEQFAASFSFALAEKEEKAKTTAA